MSRIQFLVKMRLWSGLEPVEFVAVTGTGGWDTIRMSGDHRDPSLPMGFVIGRELELLGSHGMQAYRYPEMLQMIISGKLKPQLLTGKTVTLEESMKELESMGNFGGTGITVIDRF